MPLYNYKAFSADGSTITGVVDAITSEDAASSIIAQGNIPFEIEAQSVQLRSRKIEAKDIMMFIKQLQTLMRAGVPILSGLQNLVAAEKNEKFRSVLLDIISKLNQGLTLSQAFSSHPAIFKPYISRLINAGETTGRLEEVLNRIYLQLHFEYKTTQQIKSATRYPLIIIFTTIVALFILNIWVIPIFGKLYASFKADLPLATQIILGISNFVRSYWYIVLGSLGSIVFGIRHVLSLPEYKRLWDERKLKLPIFGKIWSNAATGRFARGFSLAYASGVPINTALSLVATTVMNTYVEENINDMVVSVEKGMSLTSAAAHTNMFSPVMLQMISVGESTGALDELMNKMADIFQEEIENDVNTLGQQIEPYLLIFLGGCILVLAIGVFLPIWSLANVAIKG